MAIRVRGTGAADNVSVTTPLGSTSVAAAADGTFDAVLPSGITDGLTNVDNVTGESRGQTIMRPFPQSPDYVLHVIGQSNAQGSEAGPSPYANVIGMTKADGSPYVPAGAGSVYGVDAVLAGTWTATNSVQLVKTGTGGVHLKQWKDAWWPVHETLIDGSTFVAGAQHVVLWVQGEANAYNDYSSQYDYETVQGELFELIAAKLPGVIIRDVLLNAAELQGGPPDHRAVRAATINTAKNAVAAGRADTETIGGDYSLRPDLLHYNGAGFDAMAADFIASL